MESYYNKSYHVVVSLRNNPIHCDCDIYDFLRYLNGNMNETLREKIRIFSTKLKCDRPLEHHGKNVGSLIYTNFICDISKKNFHPDNACGVNGKCSCRYRQFDETLFINCSKRNLTKTPELTNLEFINKIELYLQSNYLTEIPDIMKSGYDKIEFLDLSDNRISNVTENILSGKLKVYLYNIIIIIL